MLRTLAIVLIVLIGSTGFVGLICSGCQSPPGDPITGDPVAPTTSPAPAAIATDIELTPSTPSQPEQGGDPSEPSTALPLGSVSGVTDVTCPLQGSYPTGVKCQRLTVSCPGVEDIAVTVAVTTPAGGSGATAILHDGGGGTTIFGHGDFAQNLVNRGMNTVQLAWATSWEASPMAQSALVAACRPATLFRWVFSTVHGGSRTAGFCALGQSGGSGAVGYAISHYGMGDTLDFAMMAAGPPFGRIDYGCDPSSYTGPPVVACAGTPNQIAGPMYYGAGHSSEIDAWEFTTACHSGMATDADRAKWAAASIVSPGAVYNYPRTPTSFWYCGMNPNNTPAMGTFFNSLITSTKEVNCIPTCSVESFYADPPTLAAMTQRMYDSCQPRHQP